MPRLRSLPQHAPVARLRRALFLAILALLAQPGAAPAADTPLAYNRSIKPLLSDQCFSCHGPDPGSRKAGLRLDTREGLFESTDRRRAAVVPGRPEESELWKRIVTTDPDDVMPPPSSHKSLSADQKELLRRWIQEGAPWQPHWAFLAPERPAVPAVRRPDFQVRNPIDALVASRWPALGLQPSPEADRRALARRVALDLTGLPPTPEDVERFVADPAPDAYERWVDRLLDSPRWGEHRARYWLDAARYADTHGLHFDNYREMWPYRDWVIRAFSRNQRFDEFTLEQLAGDLLPNPTEDQLIATGFQRCNPTTNEGGTIEAENLANYALDRVTTLGWVWLGLTANCASCHDHKFDPLTSREFYSLTAFFRNTTQSGFDGNVREGANAHLYVVDDPVERRHFEALPARIEEAKSRATQRKASLTNDLAGWSQRTPVAALMKSVAEPALLIPLREGTGSQVAGQAGARETFATDGVTTWKETGSRGAALHFQSGGNVVVGHHGDFDLGQPFSVALWVWVPSEWKDTASIAARMDEGAEHRGWDVWIQGDEFATHVVNRWPGDALKVRTRGKKVKRGEWQHLLVSFDGTGRSDGVRLYVNGEAAELDNEGRSRVRGTFRTTVPLRIGRRSAGSGFENGAVQDFRLYARALSALEARLLVDAAPVLKGLEAPAAEWPKELVQAVQDHLLVGDADYAAARGTQRELEDELNTLKRRLPVTHIQKERMESAPMARVLFRGQYDQERDQVGAGTPAALHPFPSGAPTNRLGLARWLIAPENPLTARVTVNRFWQEVFGTGLVRTTEDFGVVGEPPVNPDLLDWLAVEFVESGWDVKHLFRLMVTSSVYRQSAVVRPEDLARDPANRHLARGPRFRMDAEMLRDYALAVSGLLEGRIGGPSVKPYQPDGVWEAVAMPESDTRQYRRDSGAALYRRSLYTFWKRSAPPALMDIFNAPSRESCTVRRERTNTPLQALATLNDPQLIEAARVLAGRLLAHHVSAEAALDELGRRVLARPLTSAERVEVQATLADLLRHYREHPGDAGQLLAVGEHPVDPAQRPAELAALTLVANQLLNLDETLTK